MNTLRWMLAATAIFAGGSFIFLAMVGRGFRRSFGASDVNPLFVAAPLVGIALLVAGLLFPGVRALMHAGAVIAIVLMIVCFWQIFADSAFVLWFGVLYLAAWLAFYWSSTWRTPAS